MATQLMPAGSSWEDYAFKIGLLIKHPNADLTGVSDRLGIDADFLQAAGSRRRTPTGRLMPGIYDVNVWSRYMLVRDTRDFIGAIERLLEDLRPASAFFVDLARTGGTAKIVIQLSGQRNAGLELKSDTARALADLKIDLGLEVFPSFAIQGAA